MVMALEARIHELEEQLAQAQAEAREAVERTHRRYRRDLVPLSQAIELFGRRTPPTSR